MSKMNSAVLVLSGPSGAGKSSLIHKIIDDIGECYFSISTTTRPMRKGEVDGVDYHFVDKEEFKREIEEDQFLEYAVVHGNYYGTSLRPVKEALSQGKLVIFDIDVQGNGAINSRLGDIATSVFITPPTLSELKRRLQNRSTDEEEVIERRIKMARKEIQRVSEYEYLLINDDLEEAAKKLRIIATTARFKKSNDEINAFVNQWEDL
ncbi:MAG: guanylate kinase [Epsilonproteobacteria bacterium]|nr:guanylate kinase [Campylobacterota bacterium]